VFTYLLTYVGLEQYNIAWNQFVIISDRT